MSVDKIAIYRVDRRTGLLSEIKSSPIDSGVRSNFRMAMSPDGALLYVPGRFTSNLMVFRSDVETGALTPLKKNNFSTRGKRARYVDVSADGRFVYVTNTVSGTIAAFKVDSDNVTIKPVEGMPFRTGSTTVRNKTAGEIIEGDSPQQVIVHPSGKFLYVPNWITGEMSGFRINSVTGALTPIPGAKTETGIYPFSGTVSPSGKYLYVVNYGTGDISIFKINEKTGQLTSVEEESKVKSGGEPVNILLDKAGRFAYVPSYSDVSMAVFDVDAHNGKLTNPRIVMTRPGIRRLEILDDDEPVHFQSPGMVIIDKGKSTISGYRIEPKNGKLVLVNSIKLEGLSGLMALDHADGLVFVEKDHAIVGFKLAKDGRIKQLKNSRVDKDEELLAMHVSQPGSYLYVTTRKSRQYVAYAINNESGELKEVDRVSLPDDSKPSSIRVTPDHRLNFVLDSKSDRVYVYRYLSGFGPNTFGQESRGSPFAMGKGLSDMVVDATGQYGLMLESDARSLSVYRMPTIWGPLVPNQKKPLIVGKKPVAISMHPNGEYFYVLDAGAKNILLLRLNAKTGHLSAMEKKIGLAGIPKALSLDAAGHYAYLRYDARPGVTRFEVENKSGILINPVEMLKNTSPDGLVIQSSIQ